MAPGRTGEGRRVPWWEPVLFSAMAGGMGWGIRGQYGHETGAMIAGKTLRQLAYQERAISEGAAWLIYFAGCWSRGRAGARPHPVDFQAQGKEDSSTFLRIALLLSTWTYFLLNYAFFRFPFPWSEWTGRTPNGIIFTVYAAGLTLLAISKRRVNGAATE